MRIIAVIAGALVILGISSSVVRTLVVPRNVRSKLATVVLRATLAVFRAVAYRSSDVLRRDAILAWAAPLSILFTLGAWLFGYLVGYALVIGGLSDLAPTVAFREAGSSLFTLGFASTDRSQLTAVDFLAAATGPAIVGLLVGYLPTVYASYNRREVEVTMLESRAGLPAWGPEILARHSSINTLDNLRDLFRSWERWTADVSESHTTYPVLIHLRSPQPLRNWLIGLAAVMDAAALQLALAPDLPQGEARIALRGGFQCLRAIAATEGIAYNPDPTPEDPIELSYEEFLAAVDRVSAWGFPISRPAPEAWPHYRGWRVNYEQILHRLAAEIDAVPALWSGRRAGRVAQVPPQTPLNRQPGGVSGRPEAGK